MKTLLIVFLILPFIGTSQVSTDSLRNWYAVSVEEEDDAERMVEFLQKQNSKSGLEYAFLASAQGLLGKHAFNPYYKLDYVKQCQQSFDIAVEKSPNDPEVRFMRLAVEHYVPSFLGYSKHIDEDLDFLYAYLIKFKEEKKNEQIYGVIKNFIIETDRLSDEQNRTLNNI